VLDFECTPCAQGFELKSQRSVKALKRVCDGAYSAMLARIAEPNNPHFFFMGYDRRNYSVAQLMAVPNYLFQATAIQARKPLAATARRAGWIGCNILLDQIPEIGKIKLVENGHVISPEFVLEKWKKTAFLSQERFEVRGWTLDILKCIERLQLREFTLESIYRFEPELKAKHPDNRFIKDKIRQQLQVLRDKGYLEFKSRGFYALA
jgi:type II restriction enzyme